MKELMQQCYALLDDKIELTPRVKELREIFFSRELSVCPERAVLITQSYQETEGQPMVVRRAKALDKILSEMTLYVKEGDLLVGNMASVPRAAPVFPEFSVDWIESELNGEPYFF